MLYFTTCKLVHSGVFLRVHIASWAMAILSFFLMQLANRDDFLAWCVALLNGSMLLAGVTGLVVLPRRVRQSAEAFRVGCTRAVWGYVGLAFLALLTVLFLSLFLLALVTTGWRYGLLKQA